MLFTTDRIDEHVNFGDLLFESFPDLASGRANERLNLARLPAWRASSCVAIRSEARL